MIIRSCAIKTNGSCSSLFFKRCLSSPLPPLTAHHYNIKRGQYEHVNNLDLKEFRSILDNQRVLTDLNDVEPFNVDWLNIVRGQSKVVLRPKSTQEVSQILAHCNKRKLAVVPQGGNTGLVGGSVPVFDEIIVSMSLMNNIISLDTVAGVLVCQSGCILEVLDHYLAEKNLMMPLDLAAKGSCQIGGNISTNAGGLRLLRYGSLHGSVLGLEVVLPNGQIMDCMSTLRKDNTGYDLKQLFIGAEGTFGIVTGVSILTPPRPKSVNVALMGCDSFDKVQQVYMRGKDMLGEILSAIEFIDIESCQLVTKHFSSVTNPLSVYPFYILIETSGSHEHHDKEKLNIFLETLFSQGIVQDGTVATDVTKMKSIWALRERVSEALTKEGVTYKYDLSLPLNSLYDVVLTMRERLNGVAKCVLGYGHIGDGNIHFNAVSDTHSIDLLNLLEPYIFEWTAERKGSISAEHGLGFKKAKSIGYSKSQEAITVMKQLKHLFDPNGIMNPYKTIMNY